MHSRIETASDKCICFSCSLKVFFLLLNQILRYEQYSVKHSEVGKILFKYISLYRLHSCEKHDIDFVQGLIFQQKIYNNFLLSNQFHKSFHLGFPKDFWIKKMRGLIQVNLKCWLKNLPMMTHQCYKIPFFIELHLFLLLAVLGLHCSAQISLVAVHRLLKLWHMGLVAQWCGGY